MKENETGRLFRTEDDLLEIIKEIGTGWERFSKSWNAMKENVLKFRETTFHEEWRKKVRPLLDDTVRLSELTERLKDD